MELKETNIPTLAQVHLDFLERLKGSERGRGGRRESAEEKSVSLTLDGAIKVGLDAGLTPKSIALSALRVLNDFGEVVWREGSGAVVLDPDAFNFEEASLAKLEGVSDQARERAALQLGSMVCFGFG